MPETHPIRVLIADDHPIFRMGLRRLLECEPEFTVVGEAADGDQAVAMARSLRPDVLLLDFIMPAASGLEVLRQLRGDCLSQRTILLTAAIEPSETLTAMQLGASGVLLKTSASDLIFKCVRSVMAGEYWFGREALKSVVEAFAKQPGGQPHPRSRPFGLTSRELQVVELVATGAGNKDIATELSISEETVKHHLSKIFDKTGQSSRVELALFAVRAGLLPAQ